MELCCKRADSMLSWKTQVLGTTCSCWQRVEPMTLITVLCACHVTADQLDCSHRASPKDTLASAVLLRKNISNLVPAGSSACCEQSLIRKTPQQKHTVRTASLSYGHCDAFGPTHTVQLSKKDVQTIHNTSSPVAGQAGPVALKLALHCMVLFAAHSRSISKAEVGRVTVLIQPARYCWQQHFATARATLTAPSSYSCSTVASFT